MNKKHLTLFVFLLVGLFLSSKCQDSEQIQLPYELNIEQIEEEKGKVNYRLTDIVDTIHNSIAKTGKVIVPHDATEFEKQLFIARRIQHNDSQLVAVKMLKTLLEFELYRTKGEELYIRLLIGNSLAYLGIPLVAYNYTRDVFPAIFEEIENKKVEVFMTTHYAGLLVQLKRIEEAQSIYRKNLLYHQKTNNRAAIVSARNNLGYTFILSQGLDSAKALFKINQQPDNKNTSPVLHAFAFGNYGSVLLKEKSYDSCIFYLKKEIRLLNQINSEEGIYNTYSALGKAYEAKEQFDSSNFYFKKSIQVGKKYGRIALIIKNYKALIRLNIAEQKTEELDLLFDQYSLYNDSLFKINSLKAAKDELEVSQFLNIFKEARVSKKANDQLESSNKELLFISVCLFLLVIILAVSISIRNLNRRRLREKNLELEEKNKELNNSYLTISESNKRNELLLKELHHRVKNNLQIISSLFNLQLNATQLDSNLENVFQDAKSRIQSIGLVHKKIYQSNNVNFLDFGEYLTDFSEELLNATPNDVDLSIDINREPISIESAIPLGLIFNELFTNSLKHSKAKDLLKISIQYQKQNDREKFIYIDNGVGVKNIEVMKDRGASIGVTLIHLLSNQLNSKLSYKEAVEGEHGFWLSIEGKFN